MISRSKHNRLPVVEHGRLVGVVTRVDVLEALDAGVSAVRALARVDLAAIERNCARLARVAAPAALCAVVKADGYGHGAAPAARAAQAGGAAWLAVATADEAAALRAAGIAGPLLVMGALSPDELTVALRARADVVAWREGVRRARSPRIPTASGAGVHVKLDTGMGRLGTRDAGEATRVAAAVAAAPRLRLAGAMTHFATADDDPAFAREQLARFVPLGGGAARAHDGELLLHAANSAAALGIPEARLDMVRCGIAVVRDGPVRRRPGAPRARAGARAALLRRRGQAARGGGERRLRAPLRRRARRRGSARCRSATRDGVRRALTNDCDVLVGGRRVPLVGTVSMDNVTVDLGPEPPERGAEAS